VSGLGKTTGPVSLPLCLAASFALHLLLASPFVLWALTEDADDSEFLVVELQGDTSDVQVEHKVVRQASAPTPSAEPPAPATTQNPPPRQQVEERPPDVVGDVKQDKTEPSPPKPAASTPSPAAAMNVPGVDEQQTARTIKVDTPSEADRMRDYVRGLSRKVRANLVNPGNGYASSAKVSFVILADGQVRPDSLKVVTSSGQAKVDASALQTIRASSPFDRPPREMGISIVVDFDRKQ
jgi:protein TonB